MSVDTLTLAQRLRAAELPVEHAEAIAAAIGSAVLEGAATKEDLTATRLELKADIQLVEERLIAKIEGAKNQILIWLVGAIFASVGIVVATVRL